MTAKTKNTVENVVLIVGGTASFSVIGLFLYLYFKKD